ncbi:IS21 family transposase [Marinitoga aeolica]|uniref:IS21 family transposase n=2 Tax=Marinitoga aeolica TaxID=2809031 RepID=A0ABY8PPV1_9BACT|nr:IS21 family transposase [Marinitoga aeolica]
MYFREGKSQREISRILGINRKTVGKYVKEYEEAFEEYKNQDGINEEIIEKIAGKPKYDTSNRKPRKVTEELMLRIQELVEANETKRKKGLRKQIMPVSQMYEIIRNEGYEISSGTIYNLVRKISSKKSKEAYIKQRYIPGDIVEFDWGEIKLEINGVMKNIQAAVFTFAYSNYRYAYLYQKQNMESFIDSHVKFFDHIGGVNKIIVYDNMKVAIKKFVGRNKREITDDLMKLSTYYNFDIRFCNVRKPNEKGHVEKSVNVIKQRVFSIKYEFDTLEKANEFLELRLRYINENMKNPNTPAEEFKKEKEYLFKKPPKYEYSIIKEVYVDKYSTITVNNCRYSVPVEYTDKWLKVKLYPEKIVIYDEKPIAIHKRIYGINKWSINIEHYINTLKRKPGALHNSLAMHQAPQEIKDIYNRYFITNPRDFIMLLEYMHKNKIDLNEIKSGLPPGYWRINKENSFFHTNNKIIKFNRFNFV